MVLKFVDLIAIHGFFVGDMENWRLITYYQTSLFNKQLVETAVARELAHQVGSAH